MVVQDNTLQDYKDLDENVTSQRDYSRSVVEDRDGKKNYTSIN